MSEPDTLLVLAASYDDVAEAEADYEAVKALYYEIKTSHEFDAAVVARDKDGKIDVVKKHEQPTRHGEAHGLGWGLAIGAVCAILPGVALLGGLAVGAGAGAAIGAVTGHVRGGMSDRGPEGPRRRARSGSGGLDRGVCDEHRRPGGRKHQGGQPVRVRGDRRERRRSRPAVARGRDRQLIRPYAAV